MKCVCIGLFFFTTVIFSQGFEAKVVDILSGDFIKASTPSGDQFIRLNHIDAPDGGQPYFQNAKRYLSKLIFKKKVTIKIEGKDVHGTPLATIHVYHKNINKTMVSKGYAWWYYFYSTDMTYLAIEETAKRRRKGLWKSKSPEEPWLYREKLRRKASTIQ